MPIDEANVPPADKTGVGANRQVVGDRGSVIAKIDDAADSNSLKGINIGPRRIPFSHNVYLVNTSPQAKDNYARHFCLMAEYQPTTKLATTSKEKASELNDKEQLAQVVNAKGDNQALAELINGSERIEVADYFSKKGLANWTTLNMIGEDGTITKTLHYCETDDAIDVYDSQKPGGFDKWYELMREGNVREAQLPIEQVGEEQVRLLAEAFYRDRNCYITCSRDNKELLDYATSMAGIVKTIPENPCEIRKVRDMMHAIGATARVTIDDRRYMALATLDSLDEIGAEGAACSKEEFGKARLEVIQMVVREPAIQWLGATYKDNERMQDTRRDLLLQKLLVKVHAKDIDDMTPEEVAKDTQMLEPFVEELRETTAYGATLANAGIRGEDLMKRLLGIAKLPDPKEAIIIPRKLFVPFIGKGEEEELKAMISGSARLMDCPGLKRAYNVRDPMRADQVQGEICKGIYKQVVGVHSRESYEKMLARIEKCGTQYLCSLGPGSRASGIIAGLRKTGPEELVEGIGDSAVLEVDGKDKWVLRDGEKRLTLTFNDSNNSVLVDTGMGVEKNLTGYRQDDEVIVYQKDSEGFGKILGEIEEKHQDGYFGSAPDGGTYIYELDAYLAYMEHETKKAGESGLGAPVSLMPRWGELKADVLKGHQLQVRGCSTYE